MNKIRLVSRMVVATKPWLTYDAPRWMRCVEWWVRVRVCRQTGYLIDRWTVVAEEIDPGLYGTSNQLDENDQF